MSKTILCSIDRYGKCVDSSNATIRQALVDSVHKQEIKWTVKDYTSKMSVKKQIKSFKRAFLRIQLLVPVDFTYVKTIAQAEVVITFGKKDPYFLTNKNAIAYAYLQDNVIDVVFNDDWPNWIANKGEETVNSFILEAVALHEFMHRMGLPHVMGCFDCVMNPVYNEQLIPQLLDIQNLQQLWGVRSDASKLFLFLKGYLTLKI